MNLQSGETEPHLDDIVSQSHVCRPIIRCVVLGNLKNNV